MSRVSLVVQSGVARVTLRRPEKKNALDRETVRTLTECLLRVKSDSAARVVLLSGEGADFCAGADLDALAAMLDANVSELREDAQSLANVFGHMRGMPQPIVAAVRGRALAGGSGLATACDIVLAHEQAQFGYPEVKVGFVPAMVMSMLRRTVGEKHAFELVATGRVIGALEAERIGLVSRVLAAEKFDEEVEKTVAHIADLPVEAVSRTKRLFYDIDGKDFFSSLRAGVDTNVDARQTVAYREGVLRFAGRKGREKK